MKPQLPLSLEVNRGDMYQHAIRDATGYSILTSGQGCRDDAAYIVHAANSYPKLVEALRSMIEAHSDITEGNLHSGAPARVAVKRDARALLRELGEAE